MKALALSVGDPSGIGPEIAIAAFLARLNLKKHRDSVPHMH